MRNLFKGQIDVALILPVAIGMIYAATGNWTAERWNGALAIMGLGASARAGYERGYNTFNPELHRPGSWPYQPEIELPVNPEDSQAGGRLRDEHGRFVRIDTRDH
jgi:hypothetical protein